MNKYIELFGIVNILSICTLMFITFLMAYFNPTKSVLVSINNYHEANIELVLLLISMPIVYTICCKRLKEIKNN